jgi:hypothetical protein
MQWLYLFTFFKACSPQLTPHPHPHPTCLSHKNQILSRVRAFLICNRGSALLPFTGVFSGTAEARGREEGQEKGEGEVQKDVGREREREREIGTDDVEKNLPGGGALLPI